MVAAPLVSEFTIVGKLEDCITNSKGCIKYLYLSTPEADYTIEVAKGQTIGNYLAPCCWLKVTGMRKYEIHKDRVKYKAYKIELLPARVKETISSKAIATEKPKAKVLVCQGSSCRKNGGQICQLLQTQLQAKDMARRVEIKTTGCLKQCKQAPNLIVMPGGTRYSRVQPQQVFKLVAKHLL